MKENEIKKAIELRRYIIDNQIEIVYKQILQSAISGKFNTIVKLDFLLSDACKAKFSKLGYNLIEMHTLANKDGLQHYYDISWN